MPSASSTANTTSSNQLWIIGPGNQGAQSALNLSTYYNSPTSTIPNPPPTCQLVATDDGQFSSSFQISTMTPAQPGAPQPTNQLVPRLYIDSGGNVGINTTTPQATLEVNGSLQVDGTLSVPGALVIPQNPNSSQGTAPNGPAQPGQIYWDSSSIWIFTGTAWEKTQIGPINR